MKKLICVLLLVVLISSSAYAIDINQQDENGNTFLHIAVQERDFRLVLGLLGNDANFVISNNEGITAFDLAYTLATQAPTAQNYMKPMPPIYNYQQSNIDKKFADLEYQIKLFQYENRILREKNELQDSQMIFTLMVVYSLLILSNVVTSP